VNLSDELARESGTQTAAGAASKKEKIRRYTELYAEKLENYVTKHPYMWFNYFDFWKKS
jgi:predicted LPLAT superfamily acyltransferase